MVVRPGIVICNLSHFVQFFCIHFFFCFRKWLPKLILRKINANHKSCKLSYILIFITIRIHIHNILMCVPRILFTVRKTFVKSQSHIFKNSYFFSVCIKNYVLAIGNNRSNSPERTAEIFKECGNIANLIRFESPVTVLHSSHITFHKRNTNFNCIIFYISFAKHT